jgi:hypothetical protein
LAARCSRFRSAGSRRWSLCGPFTGPLEAVEDQVKSELELAALLVSGLEDVLGNARLLLLLIAAAGVRALPSPRSRHLQRVIPGGYRRSATSIANELSSVTA